MKGFVPTLGTQSMYVIIQKAPRRAQSEDVIFYIFRDNTKKKFTLFHAALTLVPKITTEEEFQNTLTDMSITGMPVYS